MKQGAIDIVNDILLGVSPLNRRVYKLSAPQPPIYPFVILNTAFGITHQTLQNPAVIVGEGVKLDFYANSTDPNNSQGLNNLFHACHAALINKRRILSMPTQFTFEDDSSPDVNQGIVDAIYRMTVIYRIRV